jgi:hypothetical protein
MFDANDDYLSVIIIVIIKACSVKYDHVRAYFKLKKNMQKKGNWRAGSHCATDSRQTA